MLLVTGPYLYTHAPYRGLAYLPNEMVMYYRVVRPYKTLQYGPVCHGLHPGSG